MALSVAVVSQKGGVGKSTIAALIAREYAAAGWRALIADMDTKQSSSTEWVRTRLEHNIQPEIAAQPLKRPAQAFGSGYDLIVFDGAPHSSPETKEMAKIASLVILPCGASRADLLPTIRLGRELLETGIRRGSIGIALCRVGTEIEEREARGFFAEDGFRVFSGSLPERPGYRLAQNQGRAVTETPFPSLNEKAGELAQSIIDHLSAES